MEGIDMNTIKLVLPFAIVFLLYVIIATLGNMKSLNTIKANQLEMGNMAMLGFVLIKKLKIHLRQLIIM